MMEMIIAQRPNLIITQKAKESSTFSDFLREIFNSYELQVEYINCSEALSQRALQCVNPILDLQDLLELIVLIQFVKVRVQLEG